MCLSWWNHARGRTYKIKRGLSLTETRSGSSLELWHDLPQGFAWIPPMSSLYEFLVSWVGCMTQIMRACIGGSAYCVMQSIGCAVHLGGWNAGSDETQQDGSSSKRWYSTQHKHKYTKYITLARTLLHCPPLASVRYNNEEWNSMETGVHRRGGKWGGWNREWRGKGGGRFVNSHVLA